MKYLKPILIALFLITIAVYIYTILTRQNTFDDSYMYIRYAFNLENYGVIGWNSGERTYGCTSFAYLFSTYIFIKLGILKVLEQGNFLILQSYLYFLSSLCILFLIIKDYFKDYAYKLELFYLIASFLSFITIFRLNIVFGIDTTMSLFSNMLLIYFVLNYNKKKYYLFLIPLIAYFTFFVRPDNIIFSILFPIFYLFKKISNKNLIYIFLSICFLFIIDSVLKYFYFGYVLPLPFYVKSANYYKIFLGVSEFESFKMLADYILNLSPFILIILMFYQKQYKNLFLAFVLPLILTNLYYLQTVQIMGFASRLLIPSSAFLIIFSLIIFSKEKHNYKEKIKNKKKILINLFYILAAYLIFTLSGEYFDNLKKEKVKLKANKYKFVFDNNVQYLDYNWSQNISRITNLVSKTNDSNFVIAASEHGLISSYNPKNQILCLAGLHNNYTYIYRKEGNKIVEKSIKEYKPDLIWMPHLHYVGLRFDILNLIYFQENYDFYQSLYDFGIGIRKDSKYYNKIIEQAKKDHNIKELKPTEYRVFYEE